VFSDEDGLHVIDTRQILEEFRLKDVLATSPTGAVFHAEDPESRRDVAIKLVSCSVPGVEDQIRTLFLSMAATARTGEIPGMPQVTDHGLTPEGDGFLVMDYLEGQTLDTLDGLSSFSVLNVIIDILGCIEGLSRAGTAHLNLKTENVLVINQPANDRAVALGYPTSATLLNAGSIIPVPTDDPHLAPELLAKKPLSADQAWRSDVFSLGVIACRALGAEIRADGYERPLITLPETIRSSLSEFEPLERTLAQMMEPDPMLRGGSPSEVRDPLIRAMPDFPPTLPTTAAASEAESETGSSADTTDPARETLQTVVNAPAPPASPPAAHESPAETVLAAKPQPDEQGWPEIFFDDPEVPASLDDTEDTEDTDIRNPVPEDVWVPEPGAPDAADGAPVATKPTADGGMRTAPVWKVALVAGIVVILGGILVITWFSGQEEEPTPVAASIQVEEELPSEPLVPPPEDDHLFDDLLDIQGLVDAGDLDAARAALDELDQRDGLSLSSDEAALYDSLVSAVTRAADRGAAIEDLRGGLRYGSVKMLRRGVAGLSGLSEIELSETEGLLADLERGRTAVRLHGAMWQAHRDGDHLGAIERAGRLQQVLPQYGGADDIRAQAAEELKARAEGYIASHEFVNAAAVLESLLRVWPDHDSAAVRLAWCREQIIETEKASSSIARAIARGDAGDPEAGLAMLDQVAPEPQLVDEIAAARVRLEERLAGLDAGAPVVEIAMDEPLAFKKNQSVTVRLKVTDDYRVERVVAHARNESDDGYLQIPLQSIGGNLYNFIVTPELHGNQDVYFFVVARDRSGNVGRLGAQDAPQKIERRRWFKKVK
jgi:serine/threonine-protein kinase